MRLRALVTGLLVLLALAPVRAEAATSTLVLRGSSTASVDVRIGAAFTVHMGVFEAAALRPRVTTRGTYAGAWIERIGDPNESTGFSVLPATDGPGGRHVMGFHPYGYRFEPGRYRITLLTDGASEVRITVTGLSRTLTLTPRKAVKAWAKIVDVRGSGTGMTGQRRLTYRVEPGSRTFVGAWVEAPTSPRHTTSICFEEGTVPCPAGGRENSFGVGDKGWSAEWWHIGVGGLPPRAEQDVLFTLAAPGTEPPKDLLVWAMTFGG